MTPKDHLLRILIRNADPEHLNRQTPRMGLAGRLSSTGISPFPFFSCNVTICSDYKLLAVG